MDFTKTIGGKQTALYTMRNKSGAVCSLTNYGGALVEILVPDRDGKLANVVQGHDNIDSVINSPEPFLSTLVGRFGNRIKEGRFSLDGTQYRLAINNGPNHLHGGPTGFHARVWDVLEHDDHTVLLQYVSADMEEGFPGELTVKVRFTWTDGNELIIDYHATTSKPTVVNLTHHAFISLQGIGTPTKDIHSQILQVNADRYLPIDENSIPLPSAPASVEGTPFDFRSPKPVGQDLNVDADLNANENGNDDIQLRIANGYDHCFVINGEGLRLAARVTEPVSGRVVECYTTEPGVQVYTHNWADGFAGYGGATFGRRSAIALEAQHFPDSPNRPDFPSVVLRPGEEYTQQTIYKFGITNN